MEELVSGLEEVLNLYVDDEGSHNRLGYMESLITPNSNELQEDWNYILMEYLLEKSKQSGLSKLLDYDIYPVYDPIKKSKHISLMTAWGA